MKKKITALIIAATMILGLSACADTRSALTVNGESVRAGEYIYMQINAAQEAAERFMELYPDVVIHEEGFDFFSQEIDGKSFGGWVNDRAVELLTEMAAVAVLFGELGLEFSTGDEFEVRRSVDAMWGNPDVRASFGLDYDTFGDFYEDIGVGKESIVSVLLHGMREEMVFFAIFGEDGTEAVPQEEISSYFEQNFVRYRVIKMSFFNLGDAEVIDLENMAEDFVNRFNAGESFLTLMYEYDDFVAARDAENDVWDFDDFDFDFSFDDFDFETSEIEEYDDSALPQDDENAEYDDPALPQSDENAEYDDPALPQNDENIGHNDSAVLQEEIFIEDLNDFDRLEKIGVPSFLPEHVQEFLLTIPMNTAAAYDDTDDIYVLIPLPVLEREDWLEWYSESLIFEMMEDEFTGRITAKASTLNVVLNEAAIRRYKPETAARRLLQPWL
ncbi:MAG: hypothetical protein LBC86_04640 [Oscillospiraceae bacterium]|jgi:hypothetical protein|nr:hypothetical protein [Oscillospiraceae bacterium]